MELGDLLDAGLWLRRLAVEATPSGRVPPPYQLALLRELGRHPDGITVSDLTRLTGCSQGLVSRRVAELREAGQARTGKDEADRRRTVVRPTLAPEAVDASRRAASAERVLADALSDLPADRQAEVMAAVRTLVDALAARHRDDHLPGRARSTP